MIERKTKILAGFEFTSFWLWAVCSTTVLTQPTKCSNLLMLKRDFFVSSKHFELRLELARFFLGVLLLSTCLSSIFLSRCYVRYFNCKKIGSTEVPTRGCWVNAISVLCRPPWASKIFTAYPLTCVEFLQKKQPWVRLASTKDILLLSIILTTA